MTVGSDPDHERAVESLYQNILNKSVLSSPVWNTVTEIKSKKTMHTLTSPNPSKSEQEAQCNVSSSPTDTPFTLKNMTKKKLM